MAVSNANKTLDTDWNKKRKLATYAALSIPRSSASSSATRSDTSHSRSVTPAARRHGCHASGGVGRLLVDSLSPSTRLCRSRLRWNPSSPITCGILRNYWFEGSYPATHWMPSDGVIVATIERPPMHQQLASSSRPSELAHASMYAKERST